MTALLAVLAALPALASPQAAGAQSPTPPCASSTGAVIDAPKFIAWRRSAVIAVFASTPDAQGGIFTVSPADPSHSISHPVAVNYVQMSSSGGKKVYRLKVEDLDGSAVAALDWTTTQNGTPCRAHVAATIKTGRGKLPFISVGHERTQRIIFGHEKPECSQTAAVPWKVEVKGPGGRVSESIADICGKSKGFHRSGRNPHFTLTASSGVIVFRALRPHGTYKVTYRVLVDGKVVVHGGIRVVVRKGRVVYVISIRR